MKLIIVYQFEFSLFFSNRNGWKTWCQSCVENCKRLSSTNTNTYWQQMKDDYICKLFLKMNVLCKLTEQKSFF